MKEIDQGNGTPYVGALLQPTSTIKIEFLPMPEPFFQVVGTFFYEDYSLLGRRTVVFKIHC